MKAGDIYKSNEWGDMVIVEYRSNRSVTIRFVNTGNEKTTLKANIVRGLVKDSEACNNHYANIRAAEKAKRDAANKIIADAKLEAQEEENARNCAKLRWAAILNSYRRNFDKDGSLFVGREFTDNHGLVFKIVTKIRLNSTDWLVKYLVSQNEYVVREGVIKRGLVKDHVNPIVCDLMKYKQKIKSAILYEANRHKYIAAADAYQRANVERTRVRNRNRRALRVGAEGTHTLTQVEELLNQQCNKCACCQVELTERTRELDHIMPLSLGGTNFIENLQWLCQFCNSCKSATHPDEWAVYSNSDDFKRRRADRLSTSG